MEEKRLCLCCGKEIDMTEKYSCKRKYCKECAPIHYTEMKRERARRVCEEKRKKTQEKRLQRAQEKANEKIRKTMSDINKKTVPKRTLNEILKEANEHNMSYGKYVEALERGDFI